jgi:hypothetical protein
MTRIAKLSCACGKVHIEAEQTPIISTECHCNSCRSAGARLAALPASTPVREQNGGTHYILYRKDRVRIVEGAELLREFRLSDKAPTRRVVATCCNTPVFLEFKGGHWLSLYARLWPEDSRPPVEMRTMTSDVADTSTLSSDVPHGKWKTASFYARLLGAWIAMGFKVPKVPVNGEIHV